MVIATNWTTAWMMTGMGIGVVVFCWLFYIMFFYGQKSESLFVQIILKKDEIITDEECEQNAVDNSRNCKTGPGSSEDTDYSDT